jgi:hypothetical protein
VLYQILASPVWFALKFFIMLCDNWRRHSRSFHSAQNTARFAYFNLFFFLLLLRHFSLYTVFVVAANEGAAANRRESLEETKPATRLAQLFSIIALLIKRVTV